MHETNNLVAALWITFATIGEISHAVKIGAIFRAGIDDHLDNGLRFALNELNEQKAKPQGTLIEHKILFATSKNRYNLFKQICELAEDNVVAILGPPNSEMSQFIEDTCDQLEMPYFKIVYEHEKKQTKAKSQALNLFPDLTTFVTAFEDLVVYWQWEELLILYKDDVSIVRLQDLLQSYKLRKLFICAVKIEGNDFITAMQQVKNSGRMKILVDVPLVHLHDLFITALQVGLISENYNYIVTTLDMFHLDLSMVKHNNVSITGFRLVDRAQQQQSEYLQNLRVHWKNQAFFPLTELALLRDALAVFTLGFLNASRALVSPEKMTHASCGKNFQPTPFQEGSTLHNYFQLVAESGLTGKIQFKDASRVDFKLDIIQLNRTGYLEKVGTWDSSRRTHRSSTIAMTNRDGRGGGGDILRVSKNLKPFLRVTTIAERPYVMIKRDFTKYSGNEKYEGFCIDLLKRLSEELGFDYEVNIVKDGMYGKELDNGEWDGMIGELMRDEADVAVAPLTVNYRRSQVVEFTKPYLSLGISILFRVPTEQSPSLFSFMNPLSYDIWIYLLVAAVMVTVLMFASARLSPYEWVFPRHRCRLTPSSYNSLQNWFTFPNTIWYTVSTLLKGGCDFGPKAVSTRLLGGVWWVFTLVIVSAYTANLAAVLTVDRIWIPIRSMEDLANQTEIAYGAIKGGSTMQFFSESMINTHVRMFNYMNATASEVLVSGNKEGVEKVINENYAYLMESISLEFEIQQNCNLTQVGGVLGSKGYGIATRKGSIWTEKLSSSILNFGERGIIQLLKTKWWKNRGANCQQMAASMKQRVALTMDNVAGIFLFLICGLFLAVIIALLEFCIKSRENAEIDHEYLIHSRSSSTIVQSLCSEMAQELCFAVRVNKTTQRHRFSRRCSNCAQISGLSRGADGPDALPSSGSYVPEDGIGAGRRGTLVGLVNDSKPQVVRRSKADQQVPVNHYRQIGAVNGQANSLPMTDTRRSSHNQGRANMIDSPGLCWVPASTFTLLSDGTPAVEAKTERRARSAH